MVLNAKKHLIKQHIKNVVCAWSGTEVPRYRLSAKKAATASWSEYHTFSPQTF